MVKPKKTEWADLAKYWSFGLFLGYFLVWVSSASSWLLTTCDVIPFQKGNIVGKIQAIEIDLANHRQSLIVHHEVTIKITRLFFEVSVKLSNNEAILKQGSIFSSTIIVIFAEISQLIRSNI